MLIHQYEFSSQTKREFVYYTIHAAAFVNNYIRREKKIEILFCCLTHTHTQAHK